jgi:hypothetical protein
MRWVIREPSLSDNPRTGQSTATARGIVYARPRAASRGITGTLKEVRMLRKVYLIPALALFLLPAIARAQFEQGNWEMTLGGSGGNDRDFRTGNFSVNGSLGYFLTKEFEVAVRQSFNWGDGGSSWSASTVAAADYHFDLDRLQPFVGVSIGYAYGSGGNEDGWSAGPEGGVKYFVNSTTFIYAQASYLFNLEESISDGSWFYGAGIGFKW